MKIQFNLLWLCGFITLMSTQFLQCISKYVTIQLTTTPQAYVNMVALSTKDSITLSDIKIDQKKLNAVIKSGLIVRQTAPQNSTCFSISDQGLKFDYFRNPTATPNDNIQLPPAYQDAIKKISDPNLRKEVEDAYLAFEKYLALIGTSLGERTHAVIAGDIYKKDSPYTAPVRAMYKEVRKLAEAIGLILPDPDEASWYWKYLTKRNLILGATALIGLSGIIGYKFFNMTPAQIVGTDLQVCGTAVRGAGFVTRKVGEGLSAVGGGVEYTALGITKAGTWFKTPRAPEVTPTPAPEVPSMPAPSVEVPSVPPVMPETVPTPEVMVTPIPAPVPTP